MKHCGNLEKIEMKNISGGNPVADGKNSRYRTDSTWVRFLSHEPAKIWDDFDYLWTKGKFDFSWLKPTFQTKKKENCVVSQEINTRDCCAFRKR